MGMSGPSEQPNLPGLTSSAEGSPARTSALPAAARAWLESVADFGSSSIVFLRSLGQTGALSRTSPACYPATADGTLPSSFEGWLNSGMALPGGFLTLSISVWPKDAAVCSLSAILEMDVPPRFYLSPRACRGILRRAEKRGKELPEVLHQALQQAAAGLPE